ncbi:MAG: hypothetical protein C4530_20745 [Desulfobacteraceae bacterium]|nr:MAG: hypothetical protein C4530_20745 [Desulfobacteraceae bacterium]
MKKILHFCNYSPIDSGIYPETRDLVYEEMRRGYDPYIVDHIRGNRFRIDPAYQDMLFKEGRIIGLENFDEAQEADLICWHSWIPESYMNNPKRSLVMFLHAMPSHLFYNELYGGEAVLTFLKNSHRQVANCRYFITLWPIHAKYWENIIQGNLVVTDPIICCDCIRLKMDDGFDPNHLRLVVMDTWRAGKEPYYIFNAVQLLMALSEQGKVPFRVSLDIYGQDGANVQPVWNALIRDDLKKHFHFRGKAHPQQIFDSSDILLTQVGEIPTESRVVREGLLSGIPIVSGITDVPWTPYHHDCRDIEGFADEIRKSWQYMQDSQKRAELHRINRAYAVEHYDIRKNADRIFECYEQIFRGSLESRPLSVRPPPAGESSVTGSEDIFEQLKQRIMEVETGVQADAILDSMERTDLTMGRQETLLRLMMDLPKSG